MASDTRETSAPTPPSGGMERLVGTRYSTRGFTGEPIPPALIEEILTVALKAPSWCNTQPWEVYITSGEATNRFRERLAAVARAKDAAPAPDFPMPSAYSGVHLERRRESGWQLYEAVGVTRGDREGSREQALRNFEFFGAPHVAIVTSPFELGHYGLLDVGVFVAHFLLAAHERGVATISQAALALHSPAVREFFGVPEDRGVAVGISFGWASEDDPSRRYRTSRAALGDAVHWIEG